MKYKYLLFDLDGTLINTVEGVIKSAQHAMRHFGKEMTFEELRPFVGPPLKYSFMNLCGLDEEQTATAIDLYRERYNKYGVHEASLYPEVPELLKSVKNAGYILGVATSKFEKYATEMLFDYGIGDYFEIITGSDAGEKRSSKQEIIEESLNRFGISDQRSKVLMIGDMKYDDIGAKLAHIDSFGIYTGTAAPDEHEQAGATYIAYSFEELKTKLLEWA